MLRYILTILLFFTSTAAFAEDQACTTSLPYIPLVQLHSWFDASNIDGKCTKPSDNTHITEWANRGKDHALTCSANCPRYKARQPNIAEHILFNGHASMQSNDFTNHLHLPITVFAAAHWQQQQSNHDSYLWDGNDNHHRMALLYNPITTAYALWAGNNAPLPDFTLPDNRPALIITQYNDNDAIFWLNGIAYPKVTAGDRILDGLTLGARYNNQNHFTGAIHEFLLYDYSLTTSQIQKIHHYLADKWRICPVANNAYPWTALLVRCTRPLCKLHFACRGWCYHYRMARQITC